jgi:hypothetical protein
MRELRRQAEGIDAGQVSALDPADIFLESREEVATEVVAGGIISSAISILASVLIVHRLTPQQRNRSYIARKLGHYSARVVSYTSTTSKPSVRRI